MVVVPAQNKITARSHFSAAFLFRVFLVRAFIVRILLVVPFLHLHLRHV